MVKRINPGEGTPPVFSPEEPRKRVEPTEKNSHIRRSQDEYTHEDAESKSDSRFSTYDRQGKLISPELDTDELEEDDDSQDES